MEAEHLRRKGWSEHEIAHALRIEHSHPVTEDEHSRLWILTLILSTAGIGIGLALSPLALWMPLLVSVPSSVLLGHMMGLLLTHSLRSLRITRHLHVRATLVIIASSIAFMLITMHFVQQRLAALPFTEPHSALWFALPYAAGLLIPYTLERRIHGSS